MSLKMFGTKMNEVFGFTTETIGMSWREYLLRFPTRFEIIEASGANDEDMVRFHKDGF